MSLTRGNNGWMIETGTLTRFDQIHQMQDHARWPLGSALMVKRDDISSKCTEHGILRVIKGRVEPVVYNRFASWDGLHRYGTFEDLMDDGWRVN